MRGARFRARAHGLPIGTEDLDLPHCHQPGPQPPALDVRGRLEAFCDGEVPFAERLTIQNHLAECVACSLEAEAIAGLGSTLRHLAAEVGEHAAVVPLRFFAQVVEQLSVEERLSPQSRVVALFQAMHLVWAGTGATVASRALK